MSCIHRRLLSQRLARHGPELRLREKLVAVLCLQPLSGDAVRIVPHEHVGEVCSVMNTLLRLLAIVIPFEGLYDSLEAGLMEISKGEPVPCVEPDLVRGGWQEGVGHVLHHVT